MFRYPLAWACGFLFLGITATYFGWFSFLLILSALIVCVHLRVSKSDFLLWFFMGCLGIAVSNLDNRPTVLPQETMAIILPTKSPKFYSWGWVGEAKIFSVEGQFLGNTSFIDFSPNDSFFQTYYTTHLRVQPLCENPLPIGFDEKSYYKSKDIHFKVAIDQRELVGDFPTPTGKERLKAGLKQKIKNPLHFNVVWALVSGDKSGLPQADKMLFQQLGIIHVLAVSGLHIGLVGGFFYALLYPFRKWFWVAPIGSMFLVFCYATFVGFSPSVSRAFFLFCVYMISRLVNRRPKKYLILWFSFVTLLFFNPQNLFSIGFQLSFGAVFGIVTTLDFASKWTKRIRNKWLVMGVKFNLVSIGAQLGSLPFVLYYFHGFPTYFLLSNTLAIPIITLTLYAMFLGLLVWGLQIPPDSIFEFVGWLVDLLIQAGNQISTWPFHYVDDIYPSGLFTIGLFFSIFTFLLHRFYKPFLTLSLLVFCLLPWTSFFKTIPDKKVSFCYKNQEVRWVVSSGNGEIFCAQKQANHFERELKLMVENGFLHQAKITIE